MTALLLLAVLQTAAPDCRAALPSFWAQHPEARQGLAGGWKPAPDRCVITQHTFAKVGEAWQMTQTVYDVATNRVIASAVAVHDTVNADDWRIIRVDGFDAALPLAEQVRRFLALRDGI